MIDTTKERADLQAQLYLPDANGGCESQYTLFEGLLVVPILGDPGDAPVIGRVHSPFTIRRSTFSYSKGAVPPLIPAPGTTRTGHTFLGGGISIPAPGGSAEGTLTFKASGEYSFVLPTHLTEGGKIMFDAHPYPTGVDMLGSEDYPTDQTDIEFGGFFNTYRSQYYDLNKFVSQRILG